MILKDPYGVSPNVEITIAGVLVDYNSINSFTITLEESKHDLLQLEVSGLPPSVIPSYWGQPVSLKLDTGSRFFYEFAGYIAEVRPSSQAAAGIVNGSPLQVSTIVCMGASYSMRGVSSKVWSNFKLDEIAIALANKYGFSLDIIRTDRVYDFLVQASESDWQFLTRMAELQGLSVNVHGTLMRMYDPYMSQSRLPSFHVLSTIAAMQANPTPSPGNIIEFEGVFSKRLPYQTSVLITSGAIGATASEVVDLSNRTSASPAPLARAGFNDASITQGLARLEANKRKVYDNHADVRTVGVAGCIPGGLVSVQGYDAAMDGLWYVSSVSHKVVRSQFFSDVSICRNTEDLASPVNISAFVHVDTPVFKVDRWVAGKRYVNAYA